MNKKKISAEFKLLGVKPPTSDKRDKWSQFKQMKRITTILFAFVIFSCENRTVKHRGFNDLVVGSQQIILYDNNDFYLELGAGGKEGKYQVISDTVHLTYDSKPTDWPDKLLITDQYFITVTNDEHKEPVKISRPKEVQ